VHGLRPPAARASASKNGRMRARRVSDAAPGVSAEPQSGRSSEPLGEERDRRPGSGLLGPRRFAALTYK
jgi:hypothetical protein